MSNFSRWLSRRTGISEKKQSSLVNLIVSTIPAKHLPYLVVAAEVAQEIRKVEKQIDAAKAQSTEDGI